MTLPMRPRSAVAIGLLVCLLAGSSGCAEIGVRRTEPVEVHETLLSAVYNDKLSEYSVQTLRLRDLDTLYEHNPAEGLARLQAGVEEDPESDVLFALAEMTYLRGRALEKRDPALAASWYYLCAGYAYHYLFDVPHPSDAQSAVVSAFAADPASEAAAPGERAFDPCFRQACDLYNAGLAHCLRSEKGNRLDPRHTFTWPLPDQKHLEVTLVPHGFAWRAEDLGPLFFAADYAVVGMDNQHHGHGLGVPLIGTRRDDASLATTSARYPRGLTFPVTAFYRFEGSLAELTAHPNGRLDLYNPFSTPSIPVAGRPTPLESDLTTPLAYFLSQTNLADFKYTGLLRADQVQDQAGLYLLEPYQRGKIPVILVHGLMASPLTWARMVNDLRADPAVRDHFQFWFYAYPTGNPILLTAANLRQALIRTREELDPHGRDAALEQMVVLGHSMGGLVARLLVADSGDVFWRQVSAKPFADLPLSASSAAELRRLFFFEHSPLVRRAVFLGTPFHGAELAKSLPAKLAEPLIRQPSALVAATAELARVAGDNQPGLNGGRLQTSLDLLTPGAPMLDLIAALPRPSEVRFHAIVGIAPFSETIVNRVLSGDLAEDATDGVVTYRSAHMDGVDSELVVAADHKDVKHHPRTVQELRRILLEHLRSVNGATSPRS